MGAARRKFRPIELSNSAIESFHNKYQAPGDGCWLWKGANVRGYGLFRGYRAPRVAYFLAHGVDPKDLSVCHTCDNPSCVNPAHLFLGTAKENADDRQAKGRGKQPFGEDGPGAKLTKEQALEIKALIEDGSLSQRKIARMYGINQSNVSDMKRGIQWRCLNVGG
ncbi:HNH endonuclease [Demequina muriae]|uniref:HNH endonuclease n=1 Tax=Demequina muriae TaxID=3051664 RepID=UPI00345EAE20